MKRIPYAGAEPILRKPWPQEQLQFVADLRARKVSCDAIADALVDKFGRAECANEVAKAYRYHKRGMAA